METTPGEGHVIICLLYGLYVDLVIKGIVLVVI